MGNRLETQCAPEPTRGAGGIDDNACCDRSGRGFDARYDAIAHHHAGRGTTVTQFDPQFTGPISQHGIEIGSPDLKSLPWPFGISAKGLKAAGAAPFDPYSGVTCTNDFWQARCDAEFHEQRFYARVKGFTRSVSAGRASLTQSHAEASPRACNCRRTACRSAPNDGYVGIDRSIDHDLPSRWIITVPPDT